MVDNLVERELACRPGEQPIECANVSTGESVAERDRVHLVGRSKSKDIIEIEVCIVEALAEPP
jgi:hypothetical protein